MYIRRMVGFGLRSFIIVLFAMSVCVSAETNPLPDEEMPDFAYEIEGLTGPVRVVMDLEGVSHITARTDRDAYFALGYLHARDRLFQMDYNRHLFSGTAAELIGESMLDSDIQLRTLGLRRAAEKSVDVYPGWALQLLEAYAEGINWYLNSPGFVLPPEYSVLELSKIDEWTVEDSLTVAKGIAFGLSFDFDDISRSDSLQKYQEAGEINGFDGTALFSQDLFRSKPFDDSVSIPETESRSKETSAEAEEWKEHRYSEKTVHLMRRFLDKIRAIPNLRPLIDKRNNHNGSNFWVIGGELSESGNPLIANDPHLSLGIPSIFYPASIKVLNDPIWGGLNGVRGVTFPGAPGFPQGCNSEICWGSTVNPMDVTDTYEEIITLAPVRTKFGDKWEEVILISQTYRVNDPDSGDMDDITQADVGSFEGGVTFLVPRRNNGPIVDIDSSDLSDIRGFSIQFTGFSATRELEAFFRIARARSVKDFKEALQFFDFGSQNWVYADIKGNIAYFTSGELPLREDLQSGSVDGKPPWFVRDGTNEFKNEWLDPVQKEPVQALDYQILPFGEMPQVINPAQGFIANANSDPIGVTLDGDVLSQQRQGGGILYLNPGYTSIRMGRIVQMIEDKIATGGKFTLDDLRKMQADSQLLDAQFFMPYLNSALNTAQGATSSTKLKALGEDEEVIEALGRLSAWDFSTPTGIAEGYDPGDNPFNLSEPSQEEIRNSVAATIYSLWRGQFLDAVIGTTLRKYGLDSYRPDSERSLTAIQNLLIGFSQSKGVGISGIDFFTVEEVASPEEARDYLILSSLRSALDLLAGPQFASAFGQSSSQDDYRWGKLHRIVFDHPFDETFNVPSAGGFVHLSSSLNGIARSGGYETVDYSGHSAWASGVNGFMFGSGPARRFVAEMNPDGIDAYQILPGGVTGDPSGSYYASQLGRWLTNQYLSYSLHGEIRSTTLFYPPKSKLYFPYLDGDAEVFTSFAGTNNSESAQEVQLKAWSADGSAPGFSANPANLTLNGKSQIARFERELFGSSSTSSWQGWVEVLADPVFDSDSLDTFLTSFSQYGDLGLNRLDGAVAHEAVLKDLIFTRVYLGRDVFFGRPAQTVISIANPGEEAIEVQLTLYQPGTAPTQGQFPIPAKGVLRKAIDELFELERIAGGYLLARAGLKDSLVGFETIILDDGESVVGLNGSYKSGLNEGLETVSYSAQFVVGNSYFAHLKLINTSEFTREIQLNAVRGNGLPDLSADRFSLLPGEMIEVLAEDLFELDPPDETGFSLIASLEVRSDGDGILGDVIFGDPEELEFAAAIPLQGERFDEAMFSHFANLKSYFTGIALFNPGPGTADVLIEVFGSDGILIGDGQLELATGSRISQLLPALVPDSAGRAGGYVKIISTVPLIGQQFFGTPSLSLLSSVPPKIFIKMPSH